MSEVREVARVEETPVPAVPGEGAIISLIERLATNPNANVETVERLFALREKEVERHAKQAFTVALAALQPKLPVIDERGGIKNNTGEIQSTYARWEDINDAIRPLLSEAGFALSFRTGVAQDGKITVTGVLSHCDGHQEETTITLPHDSSGNKNSVQAVGSSTSYGKRYTTISLLNITSRAPGDRDDDGARGGLGGVAQKAITDINMCETLDELRLWKRDKFGGVEGMVSDRERNEIVALVNRRTKALKGEAAAERDAG